MNTFFSLLMLSVVLVGCADMQAQRQQQADMNYCNRLVPSLAMAECQDRVVSNDITGNYQGAGAQEIIAYRKILIERVRMKKLTNAEASYAFQQKIAEMNQRIAITNALQRPTIVQPIYVLP